MEVKPPQEQMPATRDNSDFGVLVRMSQAMGKNKLFGMTSDELLPLMLIAQAEGKHPAVAALEYDVIQGKPALKSKAIHARFNAAGGHVQWLQRDDKGAKAKFTAKNGDTVEVEWNAERAKAAGLLGRTQQMYEKYPRQMYSARCLAEGVRSVDPGCLNGMYSREEIEDAVDAEFEVTPEAASSNPLESIGVAPVDQATSTQPTAKPSVLDGFQDDPLPERPDKPGAVAPAGAQGSTKAQPEIF